ncbi:MAG: hypothetical protein Ct9H300mP7_0810 [Verrucomicrobiota bacterium]|nr:MAG: hypothetical protein Ct9H300mP7_0810 [Verrucomicrobiota bacterium]
MHIVKSEPEALLLEGKLIKEFKPRYNVSFRDDKNFLLIKVNLNDPIPRFALTRVRQQGGAKYYGPSSAVGRVGGRSRCYAKNSTYAVAVRLNPPSATTSIASTATYSTAPRPAWQSDARRLPAQVTEGCDYLEGQTGEWEKELEARCGRPLRRATLRRPRATAT